MPAYIADTSAHARLRYPEVEAVLSPLLLAGELATCSVLELETLFSTRSYADLLRTRARRDLALALIPIVQADFDRAIEVMAELARRGNHRAVGASDPLVSALAERAGLTLLHYDADYDLVAAITGQPMQWVVPRGTVP